MNDEHQPSTGPPGSEATTPRVDGRTARRDRNRLAVLDAVIELFSEENLSPGVHEVADRSGISLRSVYRYFEDSDALIASAIERQFELARPYFRIDDLGVGSLEDRIQRMVRARVDLFEHVRIVYRAACIRGGTDALVHEGILRSRRRLTEQVSNMFASELADTTGELLFVLDALLQFDTLEHFTVAHDLDSTTLRANLTAALHRLLL